MSAAMPPEVPRQNETINHTTEWRLINGLRQSSHHFSRSGWGAVSGGSTRTQELRNAIHYLDIQIRRTFTILDLNLLLHLQYEICDDGSDTSLESEIDSDISSASSHSESDDSCSDLSDKSYKRTPADHLTDSQEISSPRSFEEVLRLLQQLCSLLEARVNRIVIPSKPEYHNQVIDYPWLTRLVEHIHGLPLSFTGLHFIPTVGSKTDQFLFNISEDPATADAFVTLNDPRQRRPPKETRKRMLLDAKNLVEYFFSFNEFVDKLQFSAASLDSLSMDPGESSASNESFPSFSLLQKFRQQVSTAYSVVLSHVGDCTESKAMSHQILLQLPGWREIIDQESPHAIESLPVKLFFTVCARSDWQFAKMNISIPENTRTRKQQNLCKALSNSHNNDCDLEFYVTEDCKRPGRERIPIHVSIGLPDSKRLYGESYPDSKHSLWTLIKQGHFAREQTLDLLINTDCKGTIFGINDRKALAVKLILGLMLSMDSDYVFESWNPRNVHFLEPLDVQRTPFVSIPVREYGANNHKRLLIARLYTRANIDEEEDDLKPVPQLMLLAKALLQIARGDRLDNVKTHRESEQAFLHAWKRLRRTIDNYTQSLTSGRNVDLEILPFLEAALGCLDFHIKYQICLREGKGKRGIDIAWKLIFDTVLIKIDRGLDLGGSIASSDGVLAKPDIPLDVCPSAEPKTSATFINSTQISPYDEIINREEPRQDYSIQFLSAAIMQPDQPGVVLFDTKQTGKASTADEFYECLKIFHKSYAGATSKRVMKNGLEEPRRIRIAVLDTGIDFNHPGIMDAVEEGRMNKKWCHSWVGANAIDDDDELHGTNCAYLIHKVAPEADIYVEKVFNQNAFTFYEAENIAKAIEHAANIWDVDIISMSFGLRRPAARKDGDKNQERLALERYRKIVDEIENAIRMASNKSRIFFAAASNSGKNEPRAFPASYRPRVICVHASEGNGEDGGINPEMDAGFNFMTLGMGLELAEREHIIKGGRYVPKYKKVIKSGTSFATPIAAGIAATVLDLAERVDAINSRTKEKLGRPEEMVKVLRLMSTPRNDVYGRLYYMAPWHHWENGWEMDNAKQRWVWDTINQLF